MPYTAARIVKALDRELGFRRRVYGKNVANGTMSQAAMDEEIAIFEQIKADYQLRAVEERDQKALPL